MPIRVRISLEPLRGSQTSQTIVETVALLNTGYTPESVECSLPQSAAKALGLWPPDAVGGETVRVRGYAGEALVVRVPDAVRIRVLGTDRERPAVAASVLITPSDDEVLFSDALVEALGIEPARPRSGKWRFVDEPLDQLRPGQPAETW